MKIPKLNYEAIVTWIVIVAIIGFVMKEIVSAVFFPKSDLIYYEDIEIGAYDSISDSKNLTKVGDTLIIRQHSIGRGQSYIWGKYKGYVPESGPKQIDDTTYVIYHNVVVRRK